MELNEEQKEWLEQLYREMYGQLMAYARSTLRENGLAEEAVQDTFRIACMKINDITSSASPQGWLMLALRNVVRNMLRTRARLSKLVISFRALDETFLIEQTESIDTDALYSDVLGAEDYNLLKRIVLDHYTMREAAEEFGLSVEVCKKRVQRAKAKLRKILE